MWVEHHPKGWSPRLNRKERKREEVKWVLLPSLLVDNDQATPTTMTSHHNGWHSSELLPRINLSSHGHSSTPITIIRLSGACITWPTGNARPTLFPTLSPGLPLDMTPLPGAVHLVQTQPCTSNSQTRLWHLLPNHLQWPLASAAALTSSLSKAALTLVWYQPVCLSLLLCVSLCLTLKTIMWPES